MSTPSINAGNAERILEQLTISNDQSQGDKFGQKGASVYDVSHSQTKFESLLAQLESVKQNGASQTVAQLQFQAPVQVQPAPQTRVTSQTQTPEEAIRLLNRTNLEAYIPPAPSVAPANGNRVLQRTEAISDSKSATFQSTGDYIIGNVQKLRETFDTQENKLLNLSNSNLSDTNRILEVQVELVKYTLLVDVTSKLAGKSTQAVDTLMKGQ